MASHPRWTLRPERETPSEKTRRALADDLAGCGVLIGRSRAQVIALLGRPHHSGRVVDGRDRYMSYLVGYREQSGSSAEEFLFIRFDTAERAVWVESPDGRVGRNVVTSGRRIDPPGG